MMVPTGVFSRLGDDHGHPRPTDLTGIAAAKWLYRTPDWHRALRVDQIADLRPVAPTANSVRVFGVLQSNVHTLGITERCASTSCSRTIWRYCRHSDLGRTALSIRPDMIFGKDRRRSLRSPRRSNVCCNRRFADCSRPHSAGAMRPRGLAVCGRLPSTSAPRSSRHGHSRSMTTKATMIAAARQSAPSQ